MPRRRRDRRDSNELAAPILLVGEGADDCYFFDALRSQLGIPEDAFQIETFAPVADEGGKSRMPEYLSVLEAREGFGRLKALGVVVDADTSAEATLDSLKSHLIANKYGGNVAHAKIVPISHPLNSRLAVGVFVMPDGESSGALEDLFIAAIREVSTRTSDHAIDCVDRLVECVDPTGEMVSSRRSKMTLYAWLSTRERPAVRPGQAVTWSYIEHDCSAFEAACKFLNDLTAAANMPESPRSDI
jgi:hypothetical protein